MTEYLARRADPDAAPRWFTPAEMAETLGSRHLMGLYFDDQEWMGNMFIGWSSGIRRFSWNLSPETIANLVQPPREWFPQRNYGGRLVGDAVQEIARVALNVVERASTIASEIYDPNLVAEALADETGHALDLELVDDTTRKVSWAMGIVEGFIQSGRTDAHARAWYSILQLRLEALAQIRVRERFELFPHQREALTAWRSTKAGGIIDLPTATGKTVIGIQAMADAVRAVDAPRILVLVPARLLARQWHNEVRRKLFLRDYRPRLGLPSEGGPGIWIATQQEVLASGVELAQLGEFDLMIVDEVHRSLVAKESAFAKLVGSARSSKRLGLTATVPDKAAEAILGRVCHSVSFMAALRGRLIPRFSMTFTPCPVTDADREDYEATISSARALEQRIAERARAEPEFVAAMEGDDWAVEDYVTWWSQQDIDNDLMREYVGKQRKAEEILRDSRPKLDVAAREIRGRLGRRVGFVMADVIPFADEIHDRLRDVPAEIAHSQMSDGARENAIRRFRNASSRTLLITARLADEGLDVPQASIAFNVSSPATMLNLVQRLGRILRPGDPDKPDPEFHQFESIPEWTNEAELDRAVIDSVVARWLVRAQAAAALGTRIGLNWPGNESLPASRVASAIERLRAGESTSKDIAVQQVKRAMKRAGRACDQLPNAARKELAEWAAMPVLDRLAAAADARDDQPSSMFLREHGVFWQAELSSKA